MAIIYDTTMSPGKLELLTGTQARGILATAEHGPGLAPGDH